MKYLISKYGLRLIVALLLCCVTNIEVFAKIKLPALISDNMVLQQKSTITLWGWADPNEDVTVAASWNKKIIITKAGNDGTWQVKIKTGKANETPYSIRFKASNDILVNNVLLGEVWLASGQSNMEFYMGKGEGWRTGVDNYEAEIAKANYTDIRMLDVKNTVADSPLNDVSGIWQICTPQTAADFSAVAYYFAVNLQSKIHMPIGIINSTWGGTPAESWTKQSVLESSPEFKPILDRYKEACAAYPEKYAVFKTKYEHWKSDTSSHKKGAPKEPIGPNHNKSPYKLYNGMIAPLLNYKFKGIIWYQGESNVDYAYQYRKLFPAMIENWRSDFKNKSLPFYFVQIAPHKSANPVLRESQLYTYEHISNTGIVITTDIGNATDIHPRNKKTVGERLSYWALCQLYHHTEIEDCGPLFRSMKVENDKVIISFDHNKGLHSNGSVLKGFMVAGKDEMFVPAEAKIVDDKVEVSNDAMKEPVAVRFGWDNVPDVNLFNKDGLPAAPFRTDTWKVDTQDKK